MKRKLNHLWRHFIQIANNSRTIRFLIRSSMKKWGNVLIRSKICIWKLSQKLLWMAYPPNLLAVMLEYITVKFWRHFFFVSRIYQLLRKNSWLVKNIIGLHSVTKRIDDELFLYFKICILFYVDDTVNLAETPDDLRNVLNELRLYLYYEQW